MQHTIDRTLPVSLKINKKMKVLIEIIIIAFTLFSCNSHKNINNKNYIGVSTSIVTKITTDKSIYTVDEPIELSMEVKNNSEKSHTFLPWKTPIENTFSGEFLNIIYNNKTIDYSGRMVKRKPPTEKDYITLKPFETAKGKVNLLNGYKLSKKGVYTIEFIGNHTDLPRSNSIKIEIE